MSEAALNSKQSSRGNSEVFQLSWRGILGEQQAVSLLAPVVVAFLSNRSGQPVHLAFDEEKSALLISFAEIPRSTASDAHTLLQPLLELLETSVSAQERAPLPSYASLVANAPSAFAIPPSDHDLSLGRRTPLAGDLDGTLVSGTLQRALLDAFALIENDLELNLSSEHFDRIWNLVHGGIGLPIDAKHSKSLRPDSARPSPTTPPPTTPPPTTPPPTTPPPTTPPPTTPPPTTPPPTTPPPTAPPPTAPPPTTPPRIRFFAADGHISPEHLTLEGESVRFAWRIKGGTSTQVFLQRDGITIAERLSTLGSVIEAPRGSAKYSLRAANSLGVARRDIDLSVAPKPSNVHREIGSPIGVRDVFGPSPAAIHPAAVEPGEGYFNLNLPAHGGIPALTRGWRARIFYPAKISGKDPPLASQDPLPTVFYAHGRLHEPNSPNHHRGVTFLAHHLAQRDFLFVSVDLSQVDDYGNSNITQRAALMEAAIAHILQLNEDPTSELHNWILSDQLILGGHSRGGETALLVAQNNRDRAQDQLNIRAIFTLSPTDSLQLTHRSEPLLNFFGTADGDNLIGQPILLFDRAVSWKKNVLVHGANHFNWTDKNTYSLDEASITRQQCHRFAKAYVAAFLDHFVRNQPGHAFTLKRHQGIGEMEQIPYFGSSSDPRHVVVDDFASSYGILSPNNLQQPVNTVGGSFKKLSLPILAVPIVINHQTVALRVSNRSGSPHLEEALPPRIYVAQFTHLTLRALQEHADPLNPQGAEQDFSLELEDSAGRTALVALSEDFAVPPTHLALGGLAQYFIKHIFSTYRISLGSFIEANPALDLTSIELVRLVFDRTPTSALLIDDIRFSY